MTKRERAQIQQAITWLMADDGPFEDAIASLCRMVGWRYTIPEYRNQVERVEVWELARRPARPFSVKTEEGKK